MRQKDPLSRLTGRGLKDVCLHNRTRRNALVPADGAGAATADLQDLRVTSDPRR